MEKGGEPGSARFGNFINYYSFNPPERRVKLIPSTLLSDCFGGNERDTLLALDVGCNSGVSTLSTPRTGAHSVKLKVHYADFRFRKNLFINIADCHGESRIVF